jgi:pilus assembly protein Flp/PilA
MKKYFKKYNLTRQEGQGLVEYALILVMVSVVVIGVLMILGPQISNVYYRIMLALGDGSTFSGEPVTGTITIDSAKKVGGLGCAKYNDLNVTASFTLKTSSGPVSAAGVVSFEHTGGKTQERAGGSPVSANDLGSGSGSVKVCLNKVVGYSLQSPVCASATAAC